MRPLYIMSSVILPLIIAAQPAAADDGFAGPRAAIIGGTLDQSGFTIGGGGELLLSGNAFTRIEYRYSDYGNNLRGQQLVAGLGLRF